MSFIVVEGIEGSGKSTLISGLHKILSSCGQEVICTREPGATPIGLKIRSILLDKENTKLDAKAELMLFFADRAQHNAEVIQPALARGATVICDRYSYSTLAYQGYGRGLNLEALNEINSFINEGLKPSTVLLLDISPKVGLARAKKRTEMEADKDSDSWNRFEEEELLFHTKIRDGFLQLAIDSEIPWLRIDASKPIEEILADSLTHLKSLGGAA